MRSGVGNVFKATHPDCKLLLLVFLGGGQEVVVVLIGGVGTVSQFTKQIEVKIL